MKNLCGRIYGGILHLNYVDGDPCGKNGKRWSSRIRFQCLEHNSPGHLVYKFTSVPDCKVVFDFYTKLACDTVIPCR